ncbi:DUF4352 domain-containing protein [Halorientalis salina]|uniref:DUF4352 domain-containing protein n=1 Tax=Halorientalis salina TaxID=2932266 RepID=UPI0010AD0FC9|nr:DUF4352 domain-containing protein [Halorientalis salina]
MNRSARELIAWLGGGTLLVLGVLFLVSAPPLGVVTILLGLFVFPPVRERYAIDTTATDLGVWLVGLLLVLFGLVVAPQIPPAGAAAVVTGLFAIPPVRSQLAKRTGVRPGRAVVAAVVLVGAAAAVGPVYVEMNTPPERGNVTHDPGEAFTVNAGDDADLEYTVTGIQMTTAVSPPGDDELVTPDYDAFLVVTLVIDHDGDEPVSLYSSDLGVVTEGGNYYAARRNASRILAAEEFESDQLGLGRVESSQVRVEPDQRLTRAVVFDVRAGHEYRLKTQPPSKMTEGDFHYVPLGEINMSRDE